MNLLETTAIVLGMGQMFTSLKHVYVNDDVSSYDFSSVFIGIVASSLWITFHFRNGSNYSAAFTSIGLVAQLYILQRLLAKSKERRTPTREAFPRT